ncbi:MAG: methylated-DNA--[protein]-cysteine S-methyltransferase [Lacrimispora sp.]|uniref:methylated-DNA--[protein]-cysteine S-methyltransferase n=1 Tax=Lacrimispora sp. TaxID=2719234 RepID=UPI0039E2D796
MKFWETCETDIGTLTIVCSEEELLAVDFGASEPLDGVRRHTELTERTVGQLKEYFLGKRQEFDLPLKPAGTEFQRKVWEALRAIPYGQTRTYGEIAASIGNPKACRAVGMANNRNPIPIIIPCHRVIGAGGSLVGYGGGLDKKVKLLELEQSGHA